MSISTSPPSTCTWTTFGMGHRRPQVHLRRPHLLCLRHEANLGWKERLGGEWRQYEAIFPALAKLKALGAGAELARVGG